MRKGKLFRIFAVGFTLLSLVSVSTYALAGTAPPAVQDPAAAQDSPAPGDAQAGSPVPEIRDIGYSDDYVDSYALPYLLAGKGDGSRPRSVLAPSAIEGQPDKLDWTPVRRVAVHPSYPNILYAAIDSGQGLYRSTTGGQFWRRLRIGDGSGRTIVFAGDNTTALASFGDWDEGLSKYANGGVYISSDTGNSWLDVSAGIDYTVVAAAFDPFDITRVYATTLGGGIYLGTYTPGVGVSWTQPTTPPETSIYSIAVAPHDTNVLYAGGFWEVWYSPDRGQSWYIADNDYSDPRYYNEALAVDPSDENIFYVGARRLGWSWLSPDGLTQGGVFKSTSGPGDGNLVLQNTGMDETFVLDVAQDPEYDNILYAGTWGSGFFRSDDYGDSWVPMNAGLELPYIYGIEAVPDPGNPGGTILYVATFYYGQGTFVSTDRGSTWTDPQTVYTPAMFDITTTISPDWLAAATSSGVILSDDGGVSWAYAFDLTGAAPGIVLELARDPATSNRLLAATYGGGIWTSEDAGISWAEASSGIGDGSTSFDITFSPGEPNTAYAGSYGVYRGVYGTGSWSWSPVGELGEWVRSLDVAGGGLPDIFAGTHDQGVHTSLGASDSWSATNAGLTEQRIRALKAVDSDTLVAGTNGASAWEYTFTTRSTGEVPADPEGSGLWTQEGPFITAPGLRQIAIDPDNRLIIYAATDQGVYRSINGGETWTPKNQGLGGYGDLVVDGISIDPNNTSVIYLGTWGYGVFKSTDSGDHWSRLSDPLKSSTTFLPLVLRSYRPPQVILSEGFEGTFPGSWTVGDANSDDGLYYWGKRNCRPFSGSYSAWAAGAGTTYLTCGSNYKSNMESWMIFGPFSLADASAATVSLKFWLNLEEGFDRLVLLGSDDGQYFDGVYIDEDTPGWVGLTADLGALVGYDVAGLPKFWFAIIFESDSSVTELEGAYVDDIVITKHFGTRAVPSMETNGFDPATLHLAPTMRSRP